MLKESNVKVTNNDSRAIYESDTWVSDGYAHMHIFLIDKKECSSASVTENVDF